MKKVKIKVCNESLADYTIKTRLANYCTYISMKKIFMNMQKQQIKTMDEREFSDLLKVETTYKMMLSYCLESREKTESKPIKL